MFDYWWVKKTLSLCEHHGNSLTTNNHVYNRLQGSIAISWKGDRCGGLVRHPRWFIGFCWLPSGNKTKTIQNLYLARVCPIDRFRNSPWCRLPVMEVVEDAIRAQKHHIAFSYLTWKGRLELHFCTGRLQPVVNIYIYIICSNNLFTYIYIYIHMCVCVNYNAFNRVVYCNSDNLNLILSIFAIYA